MSSKKIDSVLLATNHLFQWAGSEVIVFEYGEYFVDRGCRVTVFCNHVGSEFRSHLSNAGFQLETDAENLDLSQFDLIYTQHQTLTLFIGQLLEMKQHTPPIVYAHLSPYEEMEFPGPVVQQCFCDLALCNSKETLEKILALGMDAGRLALMPNPAPDAFFDVSPGPIEMKRVLAVSNHFPEEVTTALSRLEDAGVNVTRRGIFWESRRVTPDDLANHDAVLAIGKTVQYAIASSRPVYVYDRFGGPGWVSSENLSNAADFNFSGRCTRQTRTSSELFHELRNGFARAAKGTAPVRQMAEQFRLSTCLDNRIAQAKSSAKGRLPPSRRTKAEVQQLWREYYVYKSLFKFREMAASRPEPIALAAARSQFARSAIFFLSKMGPRLSRRAFRRLFRDVRKIVGVSSSEL